MARNKLRNFEDELNTLAELGLRRFPGQKSFNFVNCFIYCWTVITTIGKMTCNPGQVSINEDEGNMGIR